MAAVTYPTLEHVAMEARPYPDHLLKDAETGLCLFSAAFLGHNEAIHFALANVQTTCVDIDLERLTEMASLYPAHWEYVCEDAWEFAQRQSEAGRRWDVASVDTFRGNATERSLQSIDLWCSLSDRVVMTLEQGQDYDVPLGWRAELLPRNSEVFWLVLTK